MTIIAAIITAMTNHDRTRSGGPAEGRFLPYLAVAARRDRRDLLLWKRGKPLDPGGSAAMALE
jgi:hypothetical protein